MFICGLLIKALYGAAVGSEEWSDINSDVRNSGYLTSLSYSVFTGFAKDGPPSAVVKIDESFATIVILLQSSYWKTIFYALTRNVGLLSDFSGLVKQIEAEK